MLVPWQPKIAVTTPTGHIGTHVTRHLIRAGVRPMLLVRDPAKLDADVREAVDVQVGDLSDLDFVRRATEGVQAAYWVVPSNYVAPDPIGEIRAKGEVMANAARANGIAHNVFQSSIGAGEPDMGFIGGLGEVEQMFDGLPVTHLRPGYFYTNLMMNIEAMKQGVLPTSVPLSVAAPWNDPADIAAMVAGRLLGPAPSGTQIVNLGGPRDLTFADVAEAVTQVTGHAVQAVVVTDEEAKAAMLKAGLSEGAADALNQMSAGIARLSRTSPGPRKAENLLSTPIETWIYQHLRPVLG